MKRIVLATSFILTAAFAAPAAQAGTQQERMTQCNADAKTQNLSGDARKAFMKSCLSGKSQAAPATPATPAAPAAASSSPATPATPATAASASQQDKMKACNKEAGEKGLKGDERKSFMSGCLKG